MNRLHPLLAARYGAAHDTALLPPGAPALPAAAAAVFEQLLDHRSVRHYRSDPLPPGTLELLLAAAQSAPTSSNLQAWSVVVVQDAARRARLAEWANHQAHIRQAPLFLVWLADLSRLDRVARQQGRTAEANRYFEQTLVATIDAALAAQNVVVAAEALGLGTVYIGALRNQSDQVARELALPPHAFALFGLCVGWPDAARASGVKPRLPQAVVAHHERYDTAAEAEGVRAYDAIIQAFQRSQGLPTVAWSDQASQRVRGPDSLSGRHRLVQQLRDQGFELL